MSTGLNHVSVRRVARIINGGTPGKSDEFWDGEVPWATPVDLGKVNGKFLDKTDRYITAAGLKDGSSLAPAHSVLISSRAPIGYAAINRIPMAFNQGCKALVPRNELTDVRFLKYSLQSKTAVLQAAGQGSTFLEVSSNHVASLSIPWAHPSHQQQIADYLDHETAEIDAFVSELNVIKTLLQARRRTVIDEAIGGNAAPTVALKYLGELQSGLTLGKKYEGPTIEYPYLRVANVQAGHVDLTNVTTVNVPTVTATECRLKTGDVLLTEGGDRDKLGRGALWQGQIDPILHQNHVFSFRCNSKLLPQYLVYGLESTPARVYFDQTARQSTNLASTNTTIVKNFRLPTPSVKQQENILIELHHELSEMQEMLSNADKVIDLARERRAALITAAVTGQIDVTAKNKPAAEQLEDDIAQGLHKESQ